MTPNQSWWLANKQLQHLLTQVRTVEQDVLLDDIIPEIVAEATRRGEEKAWSEARELVHEVMDCSDDTIGHYEDALQKVIDAKLTSLKTP
jgi:hypothetical protein